MLTRVVLVSPAPRGAWRLQVKCYSLEGIWEHGLASVDKVTHL